MRDRVFLKFGGKEYPLLPAFSVIDAFEDRCGALTAHILNLTQGTATLRARATIIFHAMVAARKADGGSAQDMSVQNVMEAMFDAGMADDGLMLKEIELIERLLYTPEQYAVKKAERERAEKALKELDDLQGAFSSFSASQPES